MRDDPSEGGRAEGTGDEGEAQEGAPAQDAAGWRGETIGEGFGLSRIIDLLLERDQAIVRMVGVLTGRMIGVMHAMGGGAIEDSGAMVREMQEILDGYTLLLEAYDLLKAEPPRSL